MNRIGVEGAVSELDGTIFKSFPDKERLKKVFENYQAQGELTGARAAAIFSSPQKEMTFRGLENWNLYEE